MCHSRPAETLRLHYGDTRLPRDEMLAGLPSTCWYRCEGAPYSAEHWRYLPIFSNYGIARGLSRDSRSKNSYSSISPDAY